MRSYSYNTSTGSHLDFVNALGNRHDPHETPETKLFALALFERTSMHLQLVVETAFVLLGAFAASSLVHLGRDGIGDVRQLLLLLVEVLGAGA